MEKKNNLHLTGKLIEKFNDDFKGKDGNTKKRVVFVVSWNNEYRDVETAFTAYGKSIDFIDTISIGSTVNVNAEIVSRKYKDRYYTDAVCTYVNGVDEQTDVDFPPEKEIRTNKNSGADEAPVAETDDLPF